MSGLTKACVLLQCFYLWNNKTNAHVCICQYNMCITAFWMCIWVARGPPGVWGWGRVHPSLTWLGSSWSIRIHQGLVCHSQTQMEPTIPDVIDRVLWNGICPSYAFFGIWSPNCPITPIYGISFDPSSSLLSEKSISIPLELPLYLYQLKSFHAKENNS